jgi:dihydrofolate synthase/folylpolyglutamate synthase
MDDQGVLTQYRELETGLEALIGPNPFSANRNMRLERITHLLDLLGNPQRSYPTLHVGGTSGKGSTTTMIAAMLTEAGYKTGLHQSPHLQIINERHLINNQVAPTSHLAPLLAEMQPALRRVAAEGDFGPPSYFEAQVALSFLYFQRQQVDVAVVEVGLGGSLDATNVLEAAVAVLTNVGLDHTAILGDTVEAIARDKAGIIKPGQQVICGAIQPSVREIVAERCRQQGASLWQMGGDFTVWPTDNGFTVSTPAGDFPDLAVALPGDFQQANAACAVAAVQALPGFTVPIAAVRRGLRRANLPGRLELMQRTPPVILDGAHNPEKMAASRRAIDRDFPAQRRIVVLSLKSDKDAAEVLPHAVTGAEVVILTEFAVNQEMWRPTPAADLAPQVAVLAPAAVIRQIPEPLAALRYAWAEAGPDDLVWVTGSLYLVGNIREHWHPAAELIIRAEVAANPTEVDRV